VAVLDGNYYRATEKGAKERRKIIGRAIAQAVSRWLPTAAARVQIQF
jgi:hypothetical protein